MARGFDWDRGMPVGGEFTESEIAGNQLMNYLGLPSPAGNVEQAPIPVARPTAPVRYTDSQPRLGDMLSQPSPVHTNAQKRVISREITRAKKNQAEAIERRNKQFQDNVRREMVPSVEEARGQEYRQRWENRPEFKRVFNSYTEMSDDQLETAIEKKWGEYPRIRDSILGIVQAVKANPHLSWKDARDKIRSLGLDTRVEPSGNPPMPQMGKEHLFDPDRTPDRYGEIHADPLMIPDRYGEEPHPGEPLRAQEQYGDYPADRSLTLRERLFGGAGDFIRNFATRDF